MFRWGTSTCVWDFSQWQRGGISKTRNKTNVKEIQKKGGVMTATVYTRLRDVGQGLHWKRKNLTQFGHNQLTASGLLQIRFFIVDLAAGALPSLGISGFVIASLLLHVPS